MSSAYLGFTLQLISCATQSKTQKTRLISVICLDNSSTTTLASTSAKQIQSLNLKAFAYWPKLEEPIPKLSPVCISVLMIHPNPIMCLRLDFANIATHSQLLTLLLHLSLCLLITAIPRTVRVGVFKQALNPRVTLLRFWLLHYEG